MQKILSTFFAALIGGVFVGAVLIVGGVGRKTQTTTVFKQSYAPAVAETAVASASGALSAQQVYKQDSPGVVFIRSVVQQQTDNGFGFFPQTQQGEDTGSGIVLDKTGQIVTNNHVVANATSITVQIGNGKQIPASVIGRDTSDDLALLKINPSGVTLTPIALGDSSAVQVGDPTLAIGNPFGLAGTLTTGVVSALHRPISAPNGFQIDNVIQTDAPINPGNSGGPLLNAQGQVIGINSQIETGGSGSNGSVGIGFAIPINTIKSDIALMQHGNVQEAYLGLSTTTIDQSLAQLNLPVQTGALVQTVQTGSPAATAGIQAGTIAATVDQNPICIGGDIIVSVNGQPVASNDALAQLIGAHHPGDSVSIGLIRTGKHLTVSVKLTGRPSTAPAQQQTCGG